MNLLEFQNVKLKRDYIKNIDFVGGIDEVYKAGWIGTILEFNDNNKYAYVEFDTVKYQLDDGIIIVNTIDLEPCE